MKSKMMDSNQSVQLYDLSLLRQTIDCQVEMQRMVEIFITSTPTILANINDGFQYDDVVKIAKNAHQLKPSLDMLGISSLREKIRSIDKPSKVEQLPYGDLRTIVEDINLVLRKVFDQLYEEFDLAQEQFP
jgi:HPt (histidine-containing phosphotransfer) domain-containing protein